MPVPVLRSIGQHFHPVGPLTIANLTLNPNLNLFDGGNNILLYTANNCTFKKDTGTYKFGTNSAKYTATDLAHYPTVLQSYSVQELQTWVASMWVNVTTPTTVGYSIYGQCYAPDNTPMDLLGGQVISGAATGGWVRTSIAITIPVGANRVDVNYIFPSAQPTGFDSFWIDGIQFEPGSTAQPYADGDLSGYCWSGPQWQSPTLKTQFPDALRAFYVGPLQGAVGGMEAHSHMYGPNVLPLQS